MDGIGSLDDSSVDWGDMQISTSTRGYVRSDLDENMVRVCIPIVESVIIREIVASRISDRKWEVMESKGSWFTFIIGGIITVVGVAATPIAPIASGILVGAGVSMMGGAIAQTVNEGFDQPRNIQGDPIPINPPYDPIYDPQYPTRDRP